MRAGPTRTLLLLAPDEPAEEISQTAPEGPMIRVAGRVWLTPPPFPVIVTRYWPCRVVEDVVMVSVGAAGGEAGFGLNVALAPAGSPEAERLTALANEFSEVSVN